MSFLDSQTWHGRVFTGTWEKADGGETAVLEPTTGEELGRVGG